MSRPTTRMKIKSPRIQVDLEQATLREIAKLKRDFADTREYAEKEKRLENGEIYEYALLSFDGFSGPASEIDAAIRRNIFKSKGAMRCLKQMGYMKSADIDRFVNFVVRYVTGIGDQPELTPSRDTRPKWLAEEEVAARAKMLSDGTVENYLARAIALGMSETAIVREMMLNDDIVKRTVAKYATARGPPSRDFVRSLFRNMTGYAIRQSKAPQTQQPAPAQTDGDAAIARQMPAERRLLLESGDLAGYLRSAVSRRMSTAEIEAEICSIPGNPALESLKKKKVAIGVSIDVLLYPLRQNNPVI